MAHSITQAEKSLSAVCQLETREGWWHNSVQVPGSENQQSWGANPAEGQERRRGDVPVQQRGRKQGNFFFPPTFVLFGSLMGWLTPALGSVSVSLYLYRRRLHLSIPPETHVLIGLVLLLRTPPLTHSPPQSLVSETLELEKSSFLCMSFSCQRT